MSIEISVREYEWRDEGPDVQQYADPRGHDLYPHRGLVGVHRGLDVRGRLVPVGQGHHDVE